MLAPYPHLRHRYLGLYGPQLFWMNDMFLQILSSCRLLHRCLRPSLGQRRRDILTEPSWTNEDCLLLIRKPTLGNMNCVTWRLLQLSWKHEAFNSMQIYIIGKLLVFARAFKIHWLWCLTSYASKHGIYLIRINECLPTRIPTPSPTPNRYCLFWINSNVHYPYS